MVFDKRFQFVANEIVNMGGNCMVEKVTVYDMQTTATVWLAVSEDCLAMYSFDWMEHEADWVEDDYSNIMLNECSSANESPEGFHELFDFGYQQYVIDCCKYFGHTMKLTYEDLPFVMQVSVSEKMKKWYDDEGQLYETDGVRLMVDSNFMSYIRYHGSDK